MVAPQMSVIRRRLVSDDISSARGGGAMTGYWVEGASGCPIGGPFDLWRVHFFRENGVPPEDTVSMYPGLDGAVVEELAAATVPTDAPLDDVLAAFADCGPADQLEMAYAYFSEWRKRAPFMPEWAQDMPLRPARTSPEPFEQQVEGSSIRGEPSA